MAALPYIQLYVADYLGDTYHLTTEEHGAYLLLIMTYWQSGRPIPDDRLAKAARMTSERFADAKQTLCEFFEVNDAGDWVHNRIEDDLESVRVRSEKASKAAQKSWKNRSKQADAKQTLSKRIAPAMESQSHTDTDTDTDTDKKNRSNGFDLFWSTYPKKVKKKSALDIWKRKQLGSKADDRSPITKPYCPSSASMPLPALRSIASERQPFTILHITFGMTKSRSV